MLWSVLNPLAQATIYAVVLAGIIGAKFFEYSGPLKKIAFPRLCLLIIVLGGALVNHALLLLAIAIVFMFFGELPGLAWLVLPLGAALIATFAFGLGVMLGMFNVFSRDVGQVMSVVLQMWFWLTPIVYTNDTLSPNLKWLIAFNPMVALVGIYQQALPFDRLPDVVPLIARR